MTGDEQYAVLQEMMQQEEPEIAEKMLIAFKHLAEASSDGTPNELRAFLFVAAALIDRYTTVNGDFTQSQRAMLAAETLEAMEGAHKKWKKLQ